MFIKIWTNLIMRLLAVYDTRLLFFLRLTSLWQTTFAQCWTADYFKSTAHTEYSKFSRVSFVFFLGRKSRQTSFRILTSLSVFPVHLHAFPINIFLFCFAVKIWRSMVFVSECWATWICCHLTFNSLLPKPCSQPGITISMLSSLFFFIHRCAVISCTLEVTTALQILVL